MTTNSDRSIPVLSRRRFLAGAGGVVAAAAVLPRLPGGWVAPALSATAPVFTLGVASGEPRPDSVVLWTRLAPEPLADGGMAPVAVPVRYEVAEDDGFRRIVRAGMVMAEPENAHSVHVDV